MTPLCSVFVNMLMGKHFPKKSLGQLTKQLSKQVFFLVGKSTRAVHPDNSSNCLTFTLFRSPYKAWANTVISRRFRILKFYEFCFHLQFSRVFVQKSHRNNRYRMRTPIFSQ